MKLTLNSRWDFGKGMGSWLGLAVLCCLWLAGCGDASPPAPQAGNSGGAAAAPSKPAPSNQVLELLFTYGSEKKSWINEVTGRFNQEKHRLADGRVIQVKAEPTGSGECIDEVLTGRRQAHLTSPASEAFIKLGNAQSQARTGKDLVGTTEQLVLSPVVLAMWQPMAEKLGWPNKPIGWAEVLELARHPEGWASKGNPEWGRFKLGHTHPEFSNSGLISALAIVYAGAGKSHGLTLADVEDARTPAGQLLEQIEKSVVHYGSSTGFFADKMFENGPGYLSAAVLYESSVIESRQRKSPTVFPVVAIYPKEGTFWSDHPVGIVQREWVTPGHAEAAKVYIKFLRDKPQQEMALKHGFRPGDPTIPLGAPIEPSNGVDPQQPQNVLAVPEADVMDGIIRLWRTVKKHANVVLVLDTSGSMKDQEKMIHAREGAMQLVDMIAPQDRLSILAFSSDPRWLMKDAEVGSKREELKQKIAGLYPDGGTALYDATAEAHKYLTEQQGNERISAVIVLTDGADTAKRLKLEALKEKLRAGPEYQGVRVFTIGYGKDAQAEILKQIAAITQARFYAGDPKNIREVFKDISTFF